MLRDFMFRVRALLRRARVEEELDAEVRFHEARQVESLVEAGVAPDEARRRARLDFGGLEQIKEECRDARGVHVVEDTWRDACYGARLLRRQPLLTLAIVVTLALGIGATTLVFSVVGAGLMTLAFARLSGRDLGFSTDRVLTARVLLPEDRYPDAVSWAAFETRMLERVRAVPGVEAAGATTTLPLSGWWGTIAYRFVGGEQPLPGHEPSADLRRADEGYFDAMGIRLIGGRNFTRGDAAGAERVAIVNETFARRHWMKGEAAVGAFLELGSQRRRVRVVGVVGDVRHFGPAEETHAEIYLPFAQAPSSLIGLAVRSRGVDASALADELRRAVWEVDAEQPVSYVMTTGEMTRDILAPSRVSAILVNLFALIALALAAVGTYGLLASMVSHRTRELGLRMALGADPRGVVALVLRDALKPVALGIMGGLIAALALSRLLQGLLYGVSPFDPLTFAGMSVAVLATALVAAVVPSLRAARVDPTTALRQE